MTIMRSFFLMVILAAGIAAPQPKNVAYVQLLGPAGMYSLNFERALPFKAGPVAFSAGAGASVYSNTVIDVPVMAHALLGTRHQLEAGVGVEPEWFFGQGISDYQTILIGSLGYRFYFKSGIMLGLAYMPMYEVRTKFSYPGLGLNAGFRF